MEEAEHNPPAWRTSSFSNGSNCVEVALTGQGAFVRDSKNRGCTLSLSRMAWADFTTAIREGRYDFDLAQ
jgi:hypothetical protein